MTVARRGAASSAPTPRLTSTAKGTQHHITIPAHRSLRVGTLSGILTDVASYLDMSKEELAQGLLGS